MMTRHLIGSDPSDYVVTAYVDLIKAASQEGLGQGIDRILLRVARLGRWGSALADSYAGLFARTGLARTRFVLLYAILESSAPFHATLDRVPKGGFARLIGIGIGGSVAALVATILFGPVHLIVGAGRGTSGEGDA